MQNWKDKDVSKWNNQDIRDWIDNWIVECTKSELTTLPTYIARKLLGYIFDADPISECRLKAFELLYQIYKGAE